jgi:hypothetical protein
VTCFDQVDQLAPSHDTKHANGAINAACRMPIMAAALHGQLQMRDSLGLSSQELCKRGFARVGPVVTVERPSHALALACVANPSSAGQTHAGPSAQVATLNGQPVFKVINTRLITPKNANFDAGDKRWAAMHAAG